MGTRTIIPWTIPVMNAFMCVFNPINTLLYLFRLGAQSMDLNVLVQLWPIAVAFVSLVIVLAKMYNRIDVLEEKVRTLCDLHNKR